MARQQKSIERLEVALEVLRENRPMTVRQVYYQLVSRQVVKNKKTMYQAVSDLLVDARKEGLVPWEWIEDRLRQPREVSMWFDLSDFANTMKRVYRRDIWLTQNHLVECWLEKDALSGIFEDVLDYYGVTLNVGRGYDGWDSIHNAAERWRNGRDVTVLYFGDFDPSGEDMHRSLIERLEFFDCYPEIIKCALTPDDIDRYNLPPDFAKRSDSRSKKFIRKHGDISVELDALPVDVLRRRIVAEVKSRLDMDALTEMKRVERNERSYIDGMIDSYLP